MDYLSTVIPGRARSQTANPDSGDEHGACTWIPGSLAFARAPE